MIRAVVFDLWETLGTKNVGVSRELQERFSIPADGYLRRYEEAVQLHNWESEEAMARGFLQYLNLPQTAANVAFVVDVFRRGVQQATLFDGIADLLRELKGNGLRLGLLSNTTVFESDFLKKVGIEDLFDAQVYSWQVGNLKPSHEAFRRITEQLGIPKEAVLFIDDSLKNVESAQAFGMQAVQFADVGSLRRSLVECKIL